MEKRLKDSTRPNLLLLDELGYLPVDKRGANLMVQVVAARYESGSIVVTTDLASLRSRWSCTSKRRPAARELGEPSPPFGTLLDPKRPTLRRIAHPLPLALPGVLRKPRPTSGIRSTLLATESWQAPQQEIEETAAARTP